MHGEKMSKHIIQAFIILIIILLGVSLVSEVNNKNNVNNSINEFEESVGNNEEVENGTMVEVNVVEEDSSNLISIINSRVASIIVKGLNFILKFSLKIINGVM